MNTKNLLDRRGFEMDDLVRTVNESEGFRANNEYKLTGNLQKDNAIRRKLKDKKEGK
jgi:hypothetical protein